MREGKGCRVVPVTADPKMAFSGCEWVRRGDGGLAADDQAGSGGAHAPHAPPQPRDGALNLTKTLPLARGCHRTDKQHVNSHLQYHLCRNQRHVSKMDTDCYTCGLSWLCSANLEGYVAFTGEEGHGHCNHQPGL